MFKLGFFKTDKPKFITTVEGYSIAHRIHE